MSPPPPTTTVPIPKHISTTGEQSTPTKEKETGEWTLLPGLVTETTASTPSSVSNRGEWDIVSDDDGGDDDTSSFADISSHNTKKEYIQNPTSPKDDEHSSTSDHTPDDDTSTSSSSTPSPPPPPPTTRPPMSPVLGPIEFFRKAAVGVTGTAMIGVGAVLVPAPVPLGIPTIALGAAVLSTEFPETTKKVVDDAKERIIHVLEDDDEEEEGEVVLVGGDGEEEEGVGGSSLRENIGKHVLPWLKGEKKESDNDAGVRKEKMDGDVVEEETNNQRCDSEDENRTLDVTTKAN